MKPTAVRPLGAGLLLSLAATNVQAAGEPGFYAEHADVLRNVPVHVVLLNEDLRTQLPFGTNTIDPQMTSMLLQNAINNSLATVPGLSMGEAIAAAGAGGLLAGAIIYGIEKETAESAVEPAHLILQQANCTLPDGHALASAVREGVSGAPWAAGVEPRTVSLGKKRNVDAVVNAGSERHVLSATYSMTPDFSTLVTSLKIDIYSSNVGEGDHKWASRPARTERLVVLSDQVRIDPKTQDDIDLAVRLEHERLASGPAKELIASANAGDYQARKQVAPMVRAHEARLREARMPDWTPAAAAAKRSQVWAASGCQLLVDALHANNREIGGMVADLYADRLPSLAPEEPKNIRINTMGPLADEEPGIRKTLSLPGNLHLSRRGGDHASLAHLYTWYKP